MKIPSILKMLPLGIIFMVSTAHATDYSFEITIANNTHKNILFTGETTSPRGAGGKTCYVLTGGFVTPHVIAPSKASTMSFWNHKSDNEGGFRNAWDDCSDSGHRGTFHVLIGNVKHAITFSGNAYSGASNITPTTLVDGKVKFEIKTY